MISEIVSLKWFRFFSVTLFYVITDCCLVYLWLLNLQVSGAHMPSYDFIFTIWFGTRFGSLCVFLLIICYTDKVDIFYMLMFNFTPSLLFQIMNFHRHSRYFYLLMVNFFTKLTFISNGIHNSCIAYYLYTSFLLLYMKVLRRSSPSLYK